MSYAMQESRQSGTSGSPGPSVLFWTLVQGALPPSTPRPVPAACHAVLQCSIPSGGPGYPSPHTLSPPHSATAPLCWRERHMLCHAAVPDWRDSCMA